jgi:phage terminase Nu1 subunit (DNA packaging protein)
MPLSETTPDSDLLSCLRCYNNRKIPCPDEAAVAMIEKFKEVFNYVQARMAEAQQAQELQANCHRQEALILRVRDWVWLKYGKTLSNGRLSQKLD